MHTSLRASEFSRQPIKPAPVYLPYAGIILAQVSCQGSCVRFSNVQWQPSRISHPYPLKHASEGVSNQDTEETSSPRLKRIDGTDVVREGNCIKTMPEQRGAYSGIRTNRQFERIQERHWPEREREREIGRWRMNRHRTHYTNRSTSCRCLEHKLWVLNGYVSCLFLVPLII